MKSPEEIQLDAHRWEKEHNGGSVYPYNDGCHAGITRRDWLAGLAMQGQCADSRTCEPVEVRSKWAYKLADAMIARRTGG